MPRLKILRFLTSAFIMLAVTLNAQTVVYSGREYLKAGRSWPQIWEADPRTGRHKQLTATPRSHWHPWCSPDGRSVLFTSSLQGGRELLYRLDRSTKRETVIVALDRILHRIVGTIDRSRVMLEEDGEIIEIVDIDENRKIRTILGVNPVLAPNLALIAWQTKKALQPGPPSHIKISDVNGSGVLDLGEGAAPVFTADSQTLLFVRLDKASSRLELVRYNVASRHRDIKTAEASDIFDPYDLTISPDGSAIMLSSCCGRHGSAMYWRMTSDQGWSLVDENLNRWGGWSEDGLLIYATDGQDLRPLDARRNVWVGDIKFYDSRTGQARTIVRGISLNDEPRWCTDGSSR